MNNLEKWKRQKFLLFDKYIKFGFPKKATKFESKRQIQVADFFKFCAVLRIYELLFEVKKINTSSSIFSAQPYPVFLSSVKGLDDADHLVF